MTNKLKLLIVEDNNKLRSALLTGFEQLNTIEIVSSCSSGEKALELCIENTPEVILMDVMLEGNINGIESAIEIRKEFPRMPIVFYSIQDDENYYRDFCRSGILTHYAYVKKSNYLLPSMIFPLLKNAVSGLSFIDPEIDQKVKEVLSKDKNSPMSMLEPNEQRVAKMIAQGMTNEQIASKFNFKDKRTISRINGQIYTLWGLNLNNTDEKVARTRACIIYNHNKLIEWDEEGNTFILDNELKRVSYPLF